MCSWAQEASDRLHETENSHVESQGESDGGGRGGGDRERADDPPHTSRSTRSPRPSGLAPRLRALFQTRDRQAAALPAAPALLVRSAEELAVIADDGAGPRTALGIHHNPTHLRLRKQRTGTD